MPASLLRGSSAGTSWELAQRAPRPSLRCHVQRMCGYVETTAAPLRRPELPGTQVVMIVELGPPIRVAPGPGMPAKRHRGGFVAGLCDAMTLTEHDGHQRGIQLDLTPLGARLFFDLPMAELAGQVVSLDELLPGVHLAERLDALPSWDARFDLLESLLARRIAASDADVRSVAFALRRIEESGGGADVASLGRELGYSPRHVGRLFHEHVGMAPKLLSRLVRFERLVQRVRAGGDATWAELAADLGYYDQAHLVREVRHFTGATPGAARPLMAAFGV